MPAIVIESVPAKKPMFGDKSSGKSPGKGEEAEGDTSLEDDAFRAFADAVKADDAKAMRRAWAALPCPATMGEEE